jgi:ParB-like chromosome segregation protein Spo0J
MKRETIPIANVYVPIKRRATLEQKRVDELAASILEKGLLALILVRADGGRFVIIEGLHRLEAAKRLAKRQSSPSLSMHGSAKRLSAALADMPHSRRASDHPERDIATRAI